jgi:hypothetical protein
MKYFNIWTRNWGIYVLTNYHLSPINGTIHISCSWELLSAHNFPTKTSAIEQHKYYHELFDDHDDNYIRIKIITEDELKLLKAEYKLERT